MGLGRRRASQQGPRSTLDMARRRALLPFDVDSAAAQRAMRAVGVVESELLESHDSAVLEGRRERLVAEVAARVEEEGRVEGRTRSRRGFEMVEERESRAVELRQRAAETRIKALERAMNNELAGLRARKEVLDKNVRAKADALAVLSLGSGRGKEGKGGKGGDAMAKKAQRAEEIRASVRRVREEKMAAFERRAAAAAIGAAERKAAAEAAIVAKEREVAGRMAAREAEEEERRVREREAREAAREAALERVRSAEEEERQARAAAVEAKKARVAAFEEKRKEKQKRVVSASPVRSRIQTARVAAVETAARVREDKIAKLILKETKVRNRAKAVAARKEAAAAKAADERRARAEVLAANQERAARVRAARAAEVARKQAIKRHKYDTMVYRMQEAKYNLLAIRNTLGEEEAKLRQAFEEERDALLGDIETSQLHLKTLTHQHLVALGVRTDGEGVSAGMASASRHRELVEAALAGKGGGTRVLNVESALVSIRQSLQTAREDRARGRQRGRGRGGGGGEGEGGMKPLPSHLMLASGPVLPRPPKAPDVTPRPHYVSPVRVPRRYRPPGDRYRPPGAERSGAEISPPRSGA